MPFRGGQAGTPGSKFSRGGPARRGPTPALRRSQGMANRSPNSMGKVPGTRGGKVPLKGTRPGGGLLPLKGTRPGGGLQPGRPVTNPLVRPGGKAPTGGLTQRKRPTGGLRPTR